ncbi:hypothetical protein RND71_008151 [Anisodus tanguticus]|uniref:Uncharacterized protein n=1 Tax=Anisodus tanguticus TaxID=243964 RepID=A0AAE1SP25_9SOLA|nr:hypothetical protein RND71_008151 [Anisodus tanguticus]
MKLGKLPRTGMKMTCSSWGGKNHNKRSCHRAAGSQNTTRNDGAGSSTAASSNARLGVRPRGRPKKEIVAPPRPKGRPKRTTAAGATSRPKGRPRKETTIVATTPRPKGRSRKETTTAAATPIPRGRPRKKQVLLLLLMLQPDQDRGQAVLPQLL